VPAFSCFNPVEKKFLFVWILLLFLLPNILCFSAICWDSYRFFAFMWIPLCFFAAFTLSKLAKPLLLLALFFSVLSPLLVSVWFLEMHWIALSYPDFEAAEWIKANTPQKTVFATSAHVNSPVDYAGRLRLLSFAPYASNFGLNSSERENDINAIYCGSAVEAVALMKKYGATYVLDDYRPPPSDSCSRAFASSSFFQLVLDRSGVRIYKLRE
jgi:hypothetical protein